MSIVTLILNPTIDINTSVEKVIPEKKLRCDKPQREPGGGGINVSRAIAKLGGKSRTYYAHGDIPGSQLNQLVANENMDCIPIEIEGSTRESITVTDRSQNKQFRFVMPGPEFGEDEWRAILEKIAEIQGETDFIVASGSLPPSVPDDFYGRLVRLGNERDSKVIIDTTGDPLKLAFAESPFLIKPNVREFKSLADRDIDDPEEMIETGFELLEDNRTRAMVVSLEGDGALLITKNKAFLYSIPEVVVKSKVGAGDSMVAGLTLALDRGEKIEDAIKFGVAAGTAAVMTPGTELCRKEDAEKLYDRIEVEEKDGTG